MSSTPSDNDPFAALSNSIASLVVTSTSPRKKLSATRYYSDTGLGLQLVNATREKQKLHKLRLAQVLSGSTFELNAKQLALALCQKKRIRGKLTPGKIDLINDYDCSLKRPEFVRAFRALCKRLPDIKRPPVKLDHETDYYPPLADFLNDILAGCKAVTASKSGKNPPFCESLRFFAWDKAMSDIKHDPHGLKPDLIALLLASDHSPKKAYWKVPQRVSTSRQVFIAVEVRNKDSDDFFSQAATYAYAMNDAVVGRQYSIVLSYNTTQSALRFLVFHKGGLTATPPLMVNNSTDLEDIGYLFLALFTWKTVADAGLPNLKDDRKKMPIRQSNGSVTTGVIQSTLHQAVDLVGRCSTVFRVSIPPGPSNSVASPTSKSTIPVVVKCSWVVSDIEARVLNDASMEFGVQEHYISQIQQYAMGVALTNHLFLPADITEWHIFNAEQCFADYRAYWQHVSCDAGQSLSHAQSLDDLCTVILHAMLGYVNFIRKGYQHRDVSYGNILMLDSPVEKHELFKRRSKVPLQDAGKILTELPPILTTGGIVELDLEPYPKVVEILNQLGISNQCRGTLIDGDMAINLNEYFKDGIRKPSISGTLIYMSTNIRKSMEEGNKTYLQSPVDDFSSFFFVFQHAAVRIARKSDSKYATTLDKHDREISHNDYRTRDTATQDMIARAHPDDIGDFFFRACILLKPWWEALNATNRRWDALRKNYLTDLGQNKHSTIPPLFLHFTYQCLLDYLEVYKEVRQTLMKVTPSTTE